MKICIPVIENRGLESPLCAHFGSAPFFIIVDSETSEFKALENGNQHHAHGMCQPLSAIAGENVEGVLVGGIGAGALMKLNGAGIGVYLAEHESVKDALAAFKNGTLRRISHDMTCGGHGHGHSCHG